MRLKKLKNVSLFANIQLFQNKHTVRYIRFEWRRKYVFRVPKFQLICIFNGVISSTYWIIFSYQKMIIRNPLFKNVWYLPFVWGGGNKNGQRGLSGMFPLGQNTCLGNINAPISDSVCSENVVRYRSAHVCSETSESTKKEKKKNTIKPTY